ncbi:Receptor-type tyrosine-protein phosphatase N2, partial [Toxocara canis]
LNDDLCEEDETCISDGLFGECITNGDDSALSLAQPLDDVQSELLRLELARLKAGGYDWLSARTQCVLAYFKLSVAFQLRYDGDFCDVRNPENVWRLIQKKIKCDDLFGDECAAIKIVKTELSKKNGPVVVQLDDDDEAAAKAEWDKQLEEAAVELLNQQQLPELAKSLQESDDVDIPLNAEEEARLQGYLNDVLAEQVPDLSELNDEQAERLLKYIRFLESTLLDSQELAKSLQESDDVDIPLNAEEEARLQGYLNDVLAEQVPDLSELNDEQAERLLKYIRFLESTLLDSQASEKEPVLRPGEAEEAVPLNFDDDGTLPLKKDIEHLGDPNTGLEHVEHKIVKGAPALERVDGSHVYLRVSKDLNEQQLYQLVAYLENSIAVPNKLMFDDFQFDGDQLSFRVSRSGFVRSRNAKRQLDSAEGIAEAVYKRRKDIETLSGVRVDETGIGSGEGVIPVESNGRDGLFMPILLICAFTITALFTVLAVHQVKQRQRNNRAAAIPELAEQIEGKPSALYQDLCRHRMSTQEPSSGTNSKHSSTSSWSEEPISHSNMDISTGHVILSFLQEYLQNPSKIEEQWSTLSGYTNVAGVSSIAEQEQNKEKNRNPNCLPYDDTLISVQSSVSDVTSSTYINASAIHDSDPRQPAYIATQSPLPNTTADFWQMIWEQGAVLIVNLTDEEDNREHRCTCYWPESGSQLHGVFEIHLVSEHIWSEDYLVRSFYLKNLRTNETRTITQFHYLTWPYQGVPSSTKALLEFRRKVNKSYRGRAAPIVVHCTDGVGRTGTYCLLDIVLNRIAKGVKELNIAGSFEHLRDQRRGMVETGEQFKLVFSCLAEEVTAMVKALPR